MPLKIDSNYLPVTLSPTDAPSLHDLSAMDQRPGWFWRTPEGRALLRSITPSLLDDPEIGNQREED
jgi:hypothetical protein